MCLQVVENEAVRSATPSRENGLVCGSDPDRIILVAADHAFEALRGHVDRHASVPECHGHIPAGAAVDIHSIREVKEDEVVTPAAEEGVGARAAKNHIVSSGSRD